MKRCIIPWLMTLLLLVLTACAKPAAPSDQSVTDPTPATPATAQGHALPKENRQASRNGSVFPDDGGWYTCVLGTVRYYDYASGQTMTLCAQPGCSHGDSSCQAWLGNATGLSLYDGAIYAAITDDDAGAQLVRKDVSTGQITVLNQWQNQENTFYSAQLDQISHGTASVYLTRRTTEQKEDGQIDRQEEITTLLCRISDGTSRELLSPEESVDQTLLGFSDRYAAVIYTPPEQSILTWEEYASKYGENANYSRYVQQNTQRRLLLVDLDTGAQTVVADCDRDGYIMTGDPCQFYGKDHIYQCGDELRLLDVETGKSRSLLTMEHITNYWLMDNKAFFITGDGSESAVWYAGLDDGKAVRLENATDEHGMIMSIIQEGGSFFRANGPKGICVISKEDFYAGRYDNAVLAG